LFLSIFTLATVVQSKPQKQRLEIAADNVHVDRVGDVDGTPRVSKAAVDTVWIADWTFDAAGGGCDDSGWEKIDNRVKEDHSAYWNLDDTRFDGRGGITGEAAVLSHHDLCWIITDGYGNSWYLAIRIEYSGATFLSFDYLLDSEPGFDVLRVEIDEGCASR
jgi:hypothetical protein